MNDQPIGGVAGSRQRASHGAWQRAALAALLLALLAGLPAACGDDTETPDGSNQGSATSPIEIGSSLPYSGQVGTETSYYAYSSAVALTSYTVVLDGNDDVDLRVFDEPSFSSTLCESITFNYDEQCTASPLSSGLYIAVEGGDTHLGDTFTLNVSAASSSSTMNPTVSAVH